MTHEIQDCATCGNAPELVLLSLDNPEVVCPKCELIYLSEYIAHDDGKDEEIRDTLTRWNEGQKQLKELQAAYRKLRDENNADLRIPMPE